MHCWALLASGLLLCTCADAAACNGHSTPGPQNLNPIDTAAPIFVRSVLNGKLYSVGTGDDTKDLLHVWGTPHENGLAMGQLLGPKLPAFIREVYTYTESQIIAQAANNTGLQKILKMGLTVALDLSYARTKDYIKPYVMQELQGLADSTNGAVSVTDIRNVMWLGEITRGSCSMYGAWGDAVASDREGKLLQLRALDWDTEGPFKNYASIVVYHPNPGQGHAWANVGFGGWTGSITGFSSSQLALSEIGVSYPDASFGPETYLAKGYPFSYLIRDILQFDDTLEAATHRIQSATRTCDLILGVGSGKENSFSGFQYSPHVANVITDTNLAPVNASWHPQIPEVVYWGMDWICPNDNAMLSHQLQKFHGNITAENTITDIISYVGTGDLHTAVYDHSSLLMYVATARPDGAAGPLPAYQRTFVKLDMAAIFAEPKP